MGEQQASVSLLCQFPVTSSIPLLTTVILLRVVLPFKWLGCYLVKPLLEEKTNEKYEKFQAVDYKVQVVAGKNYFIKMDVGHIKVFQGLSGEDDLELSGYHTNKTKNDELTSF
ncbi:stefin A3-like 1 precursor [Rattus norvegicus]|uniref:Stefin A3-like 1 n=1 Tax=Rattus norvegicus TaxID=10116 RepID=Q6IE18_RAT|nr:stefin A3-like 1 precursor [Rattus norvegicus]CAE51901.1 TPA: stefin A3-like 1 precursor [Rattus norvegicus]|eukprot:NP_001009177.1 stefin A3-like 1 precursor [Rattus norvegicus]